MLKRLIVLIVLSLLAAGATHTFAAPPAPKDLFNGKDLSGWHMDVPALDNDTKARPPFIVRNGLLVSLGTPGGHLITDAAYEDYRLEVQYRFAAQPGHAGAVAPAS